MALFKIENGSAVTLTVKQDKVMGDHLGHFKKVVTDTSGLMPTLNLLFPELETYRHGFEVNIDDHKLSTLLVFFTRLLKGHSVCCCRALDACLICKDKLKLPLRNQRITPVQLLPNSDMSELRQGLTSYYGKNTTIDKFLVDTAYTFRHNTKELHSVMRSKGFSYDLGADEEYDTSVDGLGFNEALKKGQPIVLPLYVYNRVLFTRTLIFTLIIE